MSVLFDEKIMPHLFTVLVVENRSTAREHLRGLLNNATYAIHTAADSQQALAFIRQRQPGFVMVGQLPKDESIASLFAQIQSESHDHQTTFLVLLDESTRSNVHSLTGIGVTDFVRNPPSRVMLQRRLASHINKHMTNLQSQLPDSVFNLMDDAIVVLDAEARLVYCNTRASRLLTLHPQDSLGKCIYDLFDFDYLDSMDIKEVQEALSTHGRWRGELRVRTANGERYVETNVTQLPPIDGHMGQLSINVIRDITERKQEEINQRDEQAFREALRTVSNALNTILDPKTLMEHLLRALEQFAPHDAANFMSIENGVGYVVQSRGLKPALDMRLQTRAFALDMPNLKTMLETGQPLIVNDTTSSPDWELVEEFEWTRSYVGIPIRRADIIIGFINIYSGHPNAFTQKHAERLQIFADQVAIALENARRYDASRRDAAELRALQRATDFMFDSGLFTDDQVDQVCFQVTEAITEEFSHAVCAVYLVDDESQTIKQFPGDQYTPLGQHMLHVQGHGLIAKAIRSGEVIYAPDVTCEPDYLAGDDHVKSEIALPIKSGSRVIGAIDLQSDLLHAFDKQAVRLLRVFAERAAVAIISAQLSETRQHQNDLLTQQISERTAELQRLKARTEAILDSSSDALFLLSTAGTIQQTNRAFNQLFIYPVDGVFEQSITVLAVPNQQQRVETAFADVLTQLANQHIEFTARRSDDTTFDAEMTLAPVFNGEQNVSGVVGSLRDISARKRMERELRQMFEQERQLGELKSRFITVVSHEFRTPLTKIMTAADLLRRYYDRMDEGKRTDRFDQIADSVEYITSMLDNILTVSGIDDPDAALNAMPAPCDIVALTHDTIAATQRMMRTDVDITFEAVGTRQEYRVDSRILQTIVHHLLTNAVKFSYAGQTVSARLHCEPAQFTIEVSDTGIGIPETDLDLIFEPFHRGLNAENIPGVGLGLTIVKQFVTLHDGNIEVVSQLEQGTTVTIVLPDAPET